MKETLNGYVGNLGDKHFEVSGKGLTLYNAKQQIIAKDRIPKNKQHLLSVMLAEKDGKQVYQTYDF